jgi:hypothetical protein
MIVFDSAKAVLLLNPKTGTRSAVDYFRWIQLHGGPVRVVNGGHITYQEVYLALGDDGYPVFSFYRCPVERFMSAYNYIVSEWHLIWGNYPISPEIMAKAQAEIQELTPEDILDVMVRVERGPVMDLSRLQTKWLVPKVQLLDFRDFDAELVRLATSMGLDPPAHVPHNNKGVTKFCADDLSPETIDRIKQHYAQDYEFFASRGITFNR